MSNIRLLLNNHLRTKQQIKREKKKRKVPSGEPNTSAGYCPTPTLFFIVKQVMKGSRNLLQSCSVKMIMICLKDRKINGTEK